MVDQQLARRPARGDPVRAEHRGGEIVLGHHADVHLVARAGDRGGRACRPDALSDGGAHLFGQDVVARDLVAAGDEPPGERLAHQAEADEADGALAARHRHLRWRPAPIMAAWPGR